MLQKLQGHERQANNDFEELRKKGPGAAEIEGKTGDRRMVGDAGLEPATPTV